MFLGRKGCRARNQRTSHQPLLLQGLLFQLWHNVSLCHWEILMHNTLGSAVHHPELEIRPHQVLCWKHLLKWSLGSLDCRWHSCLLDLLKGFLLGFTPNPNPNTFWMCNNWQRGSLRSARWEINFPRWFTIPMNRCILVTSEGTGNWATAVVFCGSAWSPELSMMWARNRIEDHENSCLSWRFNPACRWWRTACTCSSCSDWSTPWMRTLSVWESVPLVRWEISGQSWYQMVVC